MSWKALPEHNRLLSQVVPGSPAAQAGLLSGDIVTHINSQVHNSHPHSTSCQAHILENSTFSLSIQAIHGAGDIYKLLEGSGDLVLTITRDMRTFTRTVRPELPQA